MYKKRFLICIILTISILFSLKIVYAVEDYENQNNESQVSNSINVQYESHVQDIGWQGLRKDAEISGTVGASKRIEAIKIEGINLPKGVQIKYQAHVQDEGWQSWKSEGEIAGSIGLARRIEAIRIKLENTEKYSVQYRLHIQDIGWQDWCEDGEISGTVGASKRVEAIQIKILEKQPKGQIYIDTDLANTTFNSNGIEINGWKMANVPNTKIETYLDGTKVESQITYSKDSTVINKVKGYGEENNNTEPRFNIKINTGNIETGTHILELKIVDDKGSIIEVQKNNLKLDKDTLIVQYQSHVQDIGWQDLREDGKTSGTVGASKRVEAIKINTINLPKDIQIKYQAHVEYEGWQSWKNEGEIAGSIGLARRIEALRIKLENTEKYSVQYRLHIQDIGWQDWCEDGEIAGTVGAGKRVEAIQIKIVEKQPKGQIYIDTDLANTTYDSDGVEIVGWKMANVPNTKIETYLDGTKIESEITYSEDSTVIRKVKGYGEESNNLEPRFNIKTNTENIETGTHILELRIVDSQGNVITTQQNKLNMDKDTVFIKYESQIQDIGWQSVKKNGETSGTTNQGKRLEAIKITVANLPKEIKLKYQAHVQDIGWQDWCEEGEKAGTEKKQLRMEAIRIKLENTEQYSEQYSVQYRVHVQDIGWQDWCEDGEYAGTIGSEKRIEAIQIKIVEKIYTEKTKMSIDTLGTVYNEPGVIKGWVMSNVADVSIKVFCDEIELSNVNRTTRKDVLNSIKGYGGDITNPTPGFSVNFDFSTQALGNHTIKVEVWSSDGRKLKEASTTINIIQRIQYGVGTYGNSGAVVHGVSGGSSLTYYRFGNGPNVFFATFCVHGFEDSWYADGGYLTSIADSFYSCLVNSMDRAIADKWTIYIFPEVNPDGRRMGYTNNGPERTTLYSQVGRGIDINRSWQTGSSYTRVTTERSYNGTAGFQAYEAAALRDFMLSHKSTSGQNVVVDLHGWENQLIGDAQIGNYYKGYFPSCSTRNYGSYGNQYIISWARQNLGAKVALVELPVASSTAHAESMGFSVNYIYATLQMLREV